MKLQHPFFISARLLPALKIGQATLSYEAFEPPTWVGDRQAAKFYLDFPDGRTYTDDSMQSGLGGFRSIVVVFSTFLTFLSACAESQAFESRSGKKGESSDLFPQWVMDALDKSEIDSVHMEIEIDGRTCEELIREGE